MLVITYLKLVGDLLAVLQFQSFNISYNDLIYNVVPNENGSWKGQPVELSMPFIFAGEVCSLTEIYDPM